jgi:hypothetical protein
LRWDERDFLRSAAIVPPAERVNLPLRTKGKNDS